MAEENIEEVIETYEAESQISEQPLSLRETISGAQNRARNCFSPATNFSVGLEGGVTEIKGIYHLVCVAAFLTAKTFLLA
jgi:non-canonical (house-cleaning) NTP pyrophosphatase